VRKYQLHLIHQVTSSEQLSRLVDQRIIHLVQDFLNETSIKLATTYSSSVLFGLCLHIDAILKGRKNSQRMESAHIKEIADNHQAEYAVCTQLAGRIEQMFGVKLPVDEVVLFTLFLCYRNPSMDTAPKPVLLYALHGEGLANAIAAAVNTAVRMDNTFAAEIPFEGDPAQLYPVLKAQIEQIDRGGGVLVMYDMDFLAEIYSTIEHETAIKIRTLQMPITTTGFEFSRRAAILGDIDALHRDFLSEIGGLITAKKPIIVTLCGTGQGGAQQLKDYIEEHGSADGFEIVALAMHNENQLKEDMAAILNDTVIHCVIGVYDPQLFGIPFIPIGEIFSTDPAKLPDLLQLRNETKEKQRSKTDYEAIYAYLDEHLEHVEIEKLKKLLPVSIEQINSEVAPLSFDTEIGLMMHLACVINRSIAKETTPVNLFREQIISRNREAYRTLRGIAKPLERAFKIILNDDEIAAMLTIIYKL
jgi:Transcriptional antiterminator